MVWMGPLLRESLLLERAQQYRLRGLEAPLAVRNVRNLSPHQPSQRQLVTIMNMLLKKMWTMPRATPQIRRLSETTSYLLVWRFRASTVSQLLGKSSSVPCAAPYRSSTNSRYGGKSGLDWPLEVLYRERPGGFAWGVRRGANDRQSQAACTGRPEIVYLHLPRVWNVDV